LDGPYGSKSFFVIYPTWNRPYSVKYHCTTSFYSCTVHFKNTCSALQYTELLRSVAVETDWSCNASEWTDRLLCTVSWGHPPRRSEIYLSALRRHSNSRP